MLACRPRASSTSTSSSCPTGPSTRPVTRPRRPASLLRPPTSPSRLLRVRRRRLRPMPMVVPPPAPTLADRWEVLLRSLWVKPREVDKGGGEVRIDV
ncbi:hypothetical protein EON65_24240 [archaeon]|nr:MAG: hypothetical protein EON65_24240 [archaeon]